MKKKTRSSRSAATATASGGGGGGGEDTATPPLPKPVNLKPVIIWATLILLAYLPLMEIINRALLGQDLDLTNNVQSTEPTTSKSSKLSEEDLEYLDKNKKSKIKNNYHDHWHYARLKQLRHLGSRFLHDLTKR